MCDEILEQLRDAIRELDGERAKELTASAIKGGTGPVDLIEKPLQS